LVAANYLYNVAKPDGLTIGAVIPEIYTDRLIKRKEVQYDWARFKLFLAEANKRCWPVAPVAGEELDSVVKEVVRSCRKLSTAQKILGGVTKVCSLPFLTRRPQ
jgi:hypothetical protein